MKLKQASDWVQTFMAVAHQKQQRYANKSRAQAPKYKVKNKVWLTLKNITTVTEMLRPRSNRKVFRERLPKFGLGSLGKRWERSNILGTFGTLATFQTCQTLLTFHLIYICRYLADRQLLLLAVNTFIYWIFNVMPNPVHHHCYPFTDFYKKFICAEPKPFFIVRKSNTFIFWKASLLVVPAGFDPRIYNIKTLHFNSSGKMDNDRIIVLFSLKKTCQSTVRFKSHPKFHINKICKTTQYTIDKKNNTAHAWMNKTGWKIPNKIWNKTVLGR